MPGRQNLLTYEVAKIIYDEGARFLTPDRAAGLAKVSEALEGALGKVGSDGARATTKDFRQVFHLGWRALLDDLVPYEAHERVTERFKALVF